MSLWQEEHFLQPAILGGLIRLRALRDESWRGRKSVFERLSGVLDAVSGELTLVHEQSAFADVIVIVGVEIEDDLGHLLLGIMELVRGLPRVEVFFELREIPGLKKKPSTSELIDWLKLLMADEIPDEILKNRDQTKAIPPLYGAMLKNEQDVQLLERLAFMHRREAR